MDRETGRGYDKIMYRIIKRFFDILVSVIFLGLVAPWLFLIIALVIKIDSRGPVFYIQKRFGYKKKIFILYKFRTMVQGDHSVDKQGRYQEVAIDSNKITTVGRFLRKTGFDELPQFINILLGDMSLVGPRPHPAVMDRELGSKVNNYFKRLDVKPGLTGWAQVNSLRGPANNVKAMSKRLEYDLWYIDHQSIYLDIKILLRTIFGNTI